MEELALQELMNLVYEMRKRLDAPEKKYGKFEYRAVRISLPVPKSNWVDCEDNPSPYDSSERKK